MIDRTEIFRYCDYRRILLRDEGVIYLLPHPELRTWISNYTLSFPAESGVSEAYTIIPHGSATLAVSWHPDRMAVDLFGPATKVCFVGQRANQAECLLIVEFQPAGLFALTGIRQKELADQCYPLELIDTGLSSRLKQLLETARTLSSLVTALDSLLLNSRAADCALPVTSVISRVLKERGDISVRELSSGAFYSERHLNRIFEYQAGMNLKSFARLVRINHGIRLLQDGRSSITFVADTAGYYDLPHFIHEFRSVCGFTPQEYRLNMSDFYSEIAKF